MWQRVWQLWQTQRGAVVPAQAHMTFGRATAGRGMSRTGVVSRRRRWLVGGVGALLLALTGYWIGQAIQQTAESNLRSELETLLRVERSMLEKWLQIQESNAITVASDQEVRRIVSELLALEEAKREADEATTAPPASASQLQTRLAKELEPAMAAHKFAGFVVADKTQRIIAAYTRDLVGSTVPQYESFLVRALEGVPTVSPPFPSEVMLKDSSGKLRSGTPTMFVSAPILDENLRVVAVLALRARPEQEFTSILKLGRTGLTGETYAINREGLLVSNSRFDEELIFEGLLLDSEHSQSILNLSVRDPGVDLAVGRRPRVRRSELPLTKAAAAAINGESGVDVSGYRGYRGVAVVGAWDWLPNYGMGVITEIEYDEAFRPLTILRRVYYSLFGLLSASCVGLFVFMMVVARLRRQAQKAAIEARQLGQYHLETKLGAGAMGVVYKGHHTMLRRPTAIKMLHVDRVNEASIARFEREVQLTCKLNNPHTVAIYDYGRTPEGVFYYAMEYLDGIDLQALVERYGAQPEGRVTQILKQICCSLYEAHSLGLVHRDIKPANIMLNRRGGEPDVVKVLDFGLVRAIDEGQQARQSTGLTGTPLYMSPEAIQSPELVDGRSDLYAVGAVGYFLLTGTPVFQARSIVELCQLHVDRVPETPSQRLGRPVSPELENALMACLEKSRAKRPQTARDLIVALERVATANDWSFERADAWWGTHERTVAGAPVTAASNTPTVSNTASPPSAARGGEGAPPSPPPSRPASGFDATIDSVQDRD